MPRASDIVVNILAKTGRFERGMRRSNRQMNSFARSARTVQFAVRAAGVALATFAATQLSSVIRQQLALAGSLQRVSEVVGFNVEQVQELRFAAEQLNLTQRNLDLGLQRFSRRVGEAAQGQGELLRITDQYNVRLRDSRGQLRSNIDILGDFADLIARTEDEQEQLRIAFKLFDSEGASLVRLLREGRDGLEVFRQAARDAGVVLDQELVDAAAEADRVLNQVGQSIQAQFLRAVAENADTIADLGEQIGELTTTIIENLDKLSEFIEKVQEGFNLADALVAMGPSSRTSTGMDATIRAVNEALEDQQRVVEDLPEPVRAYEEALATLEHVQREAAAGNEIAIRNLAGVEAAFHRTIGPYDEYLDRVERERRLAEELANAPPPGPFEPDRGAVRRAVFQNTRQLRNQTGVAQFRVDANEINRLLKEMNRGAVELGFTFQSAFEDAIVEGRKLRDVMRGLLQDILRILVRTSLSEPLGAAFGSLFSGKGFKIPTKDSGGTFSGPFISKTPELIIPSGSGTVKPTMASLSGATIMMPLNFNIESGADAVTAEATLRPFGERVVQLAVAEIRRLDSRRELFER